MNFKITALSSQIDQELRKKIDNKTKPLGSLGLLEDIAFKIAKIQNNLNPTITKPTLAVFAGDHGISDDGVSVYPKSVSYQMLLNYMEGGAAANVFSRQHGIDFKVIDAGVDFDFDPSLAIINRKIARGTKNFRVEAAMSMQQCEKAIATGAEIIQDIHSNGCNFISFGEKGIGNTSSASLILHLLTNTPLKDCIGRGTGLDDEGLNKKVDILQEALSNYKGNKDLMNVLSYFGGFEIAMIVGGMLKAAELKMTILVDGFIITSALLVAWNINKNVTDYCLFAHKSNEKAHKVMLNTMKGKAIIDIGMRLGEGTGAMVCFPIIKSAVCFLNQMASFESASVSGQE